MRAALALVLFTMTAFAHDPSTVLARTLPVVGKARTST